MRQFECGAPVNDAVFAVDDALVVAALWSGRVAVFDTYESGSDAEVGKPLRVVDLVPDGVSLQRLAYRPNGKHLAAVDAAGRVHVVTVSVPRGEQPGAVRALPTSVRAAAPVQVGAARATDCAYDGAAAGSNPLGALYGGGSDADTQRLLMASDAGGAVAVHSAAAGVPLTRWPDDEDVRESAAERKCLLFVDFLVLLLSTFFVSVR